jgi:hypothetical protein
MFVSQRKKIASTFFTYGDEKPNIKQNTQNPAHGELEPCKCYIASHHAKLLLVNSGESCEIK